MLSNKNYVCLRRIEINVARLIGGDNFIMKGSNIDPANEEKSKYPPNQATGSTSSARGATPLDESSANCTNARFRTNQKNGNTKNAVIMSRMKVDRTAIP